MIACRAAGSNGKKQHGKRHCQQGSPVTKRHPGVKRRCNSLLTGQRAAPCTTRKHKHNQAYNMSKLHLFLFFLLASMPLLAGALPCRV